MHASLPTGGLITPANAKLHMWIYMLCHDVSVNHTISMYMHAPLICTSKRCMGREAGIIMVQELTEWDKYIITEVHKIIPIDNIIRIQLHPLHFMPLPIFGLQPS